MSKIIDLNNFSDGAVAERFNQELQKVLENIADPNTDSKAVRTLTLTLSFKADDKRDVVVTNAIAKSKLAPARAIESKLLMDIDGKGKVTGAELKSGVKGQTRLDVETGEIQEDTGSKIYSFRQTKEEGK